MTSDNRSILFVLVAVVVLILGYTAMTRPEHRTVGEKIDDAVNSLEDRTPAEKIQDEMKK